MPGHRVSPMTSLETKKDDSIDRLLEVRELTKYFPVRRGFFQKISGWVKAVDGVTFQIRRGEILGLVGESGCGKSTIGRLVLRLLDADRGKIVYDGQDITDLNQRDLKPLRSRIQIVFQDPFGSLNPRMTVGHSVEEGLRVIGIRHYHDRSERVKALLNMVGIPSAAADRYPHEFSGGQRQRIGIARALSVEPDLIICDEPISALDVSIQAQIINLLKHLQDRLGLSYLFISHDLNVVGYICDTVAVMYLGHIMEYAPAAELFDHPVHPYTLALLSASPTIDVKQKKPFETIRGEVPSPLDPPPGCRFQGRCPLVETRCRKNDVDFFEVDNNHLVRCWKVI